jgi:hypothetical protein
MTMSRVVTAETLDELDPADPAARHSRRDLVRVHRAMGTRSIVLRGWRALVSTQRAGAPLRILELGAGDGSLLLGVARALAPRWPQVELSLMDRQDIVTPATLAGFAEVGWSARVQRADVLAWAARTPDAAQCLPAPRWDLISTALFLHHFDGGELDLLLAAAAARCDRFFACEPHRSWLALAGSHLVGAIGANAVTRQDAVLSVRAGFRGCEIAARWPQTGQQWQTWESAAGLFSHCFSARRNGADR